MTDTQASTESTTEALEATPVELPWADVEAEHFKLLRLAPLTTDRASGARPLRFVQFGYAERHHKTRSLLRLEIQLPGQRVRKEQNHLDMWVDHSTKRVHFGPESGLQVEPVNRGIGRFLAAQAAIWAQKHWSHYSVDGAALQNKDALNEDTRLRRDHFLKVQGFEVLYADAPLHLKGSYKDVQVGELRIQWDTEKLQFVEILEAAQMLQTAEQNLQQQDVKLRQQQEHISKFKREDTSLRFTITCLVAFAMFQAGLLIWIATRH